MHFQLYLLESKRFKSFSDNQTLEKIFNHLIKEENIDKMIRSTKNGRPALEAVVYDLEGYMNHEYDLELNHRHRQVSGSMIRYIMGHYGYFPGPAKPLKEGRFVKTAIVYYKG
ncbi:hypothetical protein EZV73_10620 [Acidaminobacter sp. JC074]|uniref:hypothetical protein n=1 Tax=Acidaminobacter sp. JC074 TaxID=2530199 RepID=UPI001F0D7D64|nr:hypothetical protein [Acidaminobacter sp. JC074]MCH4888030.1 hypothetical protein [Acidaminobacter sp. JC074]